ncbi:hypothetical protein [Rhizobium sp. SGZ-381]|uniref:hypothetical protein n=1 Tax=Rhizobium sp. SGZ-381 TaxID=3342800 RepID=UPI00367213B1
MINEYNPIKQGQRAIMHRTIFILASLYISLSHTGIASADDVVQVPSPQTACGSPAKTVALPVAAGVLQASAKSEEPCIGAARENTLTFSGLDLTGSVQTYKEKGYTLIGRSGLKPCSADGDCIRGLREKGSPHISAYAGASINFNLSIDDPDRPFRLKALKICNLSQTAPTQSIMFVGQLADGGTTAFAVTVRGNSTRDQLFIFPESFRNLVSVSWSPKNTAVADIVLSN